MRHSNKFLIVGLVATMHTAAHAKEEWQNSRKAENQEFYSIISEEASVSETLDKRVFRNTVKMIDRKNTSVELAHPGVSITPTRSEPRLVITGYRSADHDPQRKELEKQFEFTRMELYRKPFYKIPVVVKADSYETLFANTIPKQAALSEADEIRLSVDRAFAAHEASMTMKPAPTVTPVSGFSSPGQKRSDSVESALEVTSSDVKDVTIHSAEIGNELFNTRLRPTKRKGFFDVLKEVFSGK